MAPQVQASRVLQFGAFEVDLRTGTLRKSGARIKLQERPFQVLTMLLEKPGDMVTREELRQKLWPADTFVDFDNGLNTAIKKLRDTLGDSADSPRFIETLPKRGYRFIYPVNGARAPAAVQVLPPVGWWRQPWVTVLLALTALLAIAVAANIGGLGDRITGRVNVGPIASVAVLPCKNLTGDPEQEFLADGLTDVLTTHLAQVKSLTVPSVTSSMYFKGEHKKLSDIAQELKVQAMVEPSVQRSGQRLLINFQLIHTPTDRHLWARSYEVDPRNVQALLPRWRARLSKR
jgi:TolB-like protein/DNA-binding winged helix-turn-helix (wHTH) protein